MVYDKGQNKQCYQFLKLRKIYMNTFYENLTFKYLFICVSISFYASWLSIEAKEGLGLLENLVTPRLQTARSS